MAPAPAAQQAAPATDEIGRAIRYPFIADVMGSLRPHINRASQDPGSSAAHNARCRAALALHQGYSPVEAMEAAL